LAQPPLVYIELLEAIQISREGKKMAGRRKIFGPHAWVFSYYGAKKVKTYRFEILEINAWHMEKIVKMR
jgi:hypothetical protein